MGTQRGPGNSSLLPPFTRTWSWITNFCYFSLLVLHPLNLESQNQTKNITVAFPSSQIKFEANRSRGSWVMIGKQTERQTEITTVKQSNNEIELQTITKFPGSVFIRKEGGAGIISYMFGLIVVNLSCKNSHYYTVLAIKHAYSYTGGSRILILKRSARVRIEIITR